MNLIRLIARLDIKAPNLIKGIQLEGVRVIGDPQTYALRYYQEGIDELLYMDAVASLYGRNSLIDLVKYTASNVFVPFTVGGGIRSVDDVSALLRAGADKIAINTAAINNPELITKVAQKFGAQCMVLSIEAKKPLSGDWEAYTDNGREKTGRTVMEWAVEGEQRGAGEILLTSVDREGTRSGFDTELIRQVASVVSIPVIASGGMGCPEHLVDVAQHCQVSAIAMADILHYKRMTLSDIRTAVHNAGIPVRLR